MREREREREGERERDHSALYYPKNHCCFGATAHNNAAYLRPTIVSAIVDRGLSRRALRVSCPMADKNDFIISYIYIFFIDRIVLFGRNTYR